MCPDQIWLPLDGVVGHGDGVATLQWEKVQWWHGRGRVRYPPLLTLDLDVLTQAFVRCFFNNPKSEELMAKQDTWRVDVRREMSKPLAGVFEPIVRAMERENRRRLDILGRMRLLEGWQAPDPTLSSSWISLEVSKDLEGVFLGEASHGAACLLEDFAYYRSLFGPQRVEDKVLWQHFFAKGLHISPSSTSFVFYKILNGEEEKRSLYGCYKSRDYHFY